MAKHNRTFHTCDICGTEMDRPYNGGQCGTFAMTADLSYAVAGYSISWKELCGPCNSWLGRQISDLQETAKNMRAAHNAR